MICISQEYELRVKTNADCKASAVFHYNQRNYNPTGGDQLFAGLADIDSKEKLNYGMIMVAGHNLNLQMVDFQNSEQTYYEIDEILQYRTPLEDRSEEVEINGEFFKEFKEDEASVIMEYNGTRVRLPKSNSMYSKPFNETWPRGIREIESERFMMNIHGTFYEMPRAAGLNSLRPVTTHNKKLMDYCTWRGMLVLSGIDSIATPGEHIFKSSDGSTGLWFGNVDDLWKLGKPVGIGGPWKNSDVQANQPSDKYLMTGYDKKSLELYADKDVIVKIEVDIDFYGWHVYDEIQLRKGEKYLLDFEDGFNAHWIRFIADKSCRATAILTYK